MGRLQRITGFHPVYRSSTYVNTLRFRRSDSS